MPIAARRRRTLALCAQLGSTICFHLLKEFYSTAESFGVSAQIGSGVVRGRPGGKVPRGFHQGSTRLPPGFHMLLGISPELILLFTLLVLKGIYDYWIFVSLSSGLKANGSVAGLRSKAVRVSWLLKNVCDVSFRAKKATSGSFARRRVAERIQRSNAAAQAKVCKLTGLAGVKSLFCLRQSS